MGGVWVPYLKSRIKQKLSQNQGHQKIDDWKFPLIGTFHWKAKDGTPKIWTRVMTVDMKGLHIGFLRPKWCETLNFGHGFVGETNHWQHEEIQRSFVFSCSIKNLYDRIMVGQTSILLTGQLWNQSGHAKSETLSFVFVFVHSKIHKFVIDRIRMDHGLNGSPGNLYFQSHLWGLLKWFSMAAHGY